MRFAIVASSLLLVAAARSAWAQAGVDACTPDSMAHALDFWVGEWRVTDAGGRETYGENRIERVLGGCAILEHWRGAGGGEGKSLFYYDPSARRWKQVWVTPQVTRPGGLKEKRLIGRWPDGAVRFQGELTGPGGEVTLDRTTLTPLVDGRVRQVIEISRDGGSSWQVTFDGYYRRLR